MECTQSSPDGSSIRNVAPVTGSWPRSAACSLRTRAAAASTASVVPNVRMPTNSTVRWNLDHALRGSNSAEFW